MKHVLLVIVGVLIPSIAFAQASITGTVRDVSGAVLPGVTVEAASPALIEKVRTVVTDGAGQYRVVDLRPGTYSVTFTLPGFSTSRRDGIELAGSFTASVNAELRVGALEETITVTGESPVVDVQGVRQQQVINKDVIDTIPSGRTHFSIAELIPGVNTSNTSDVGGSNAVALVQMTAHGSGSSTSPPASRSSTSVRGRSCRPATSRSPPATSSAGKTSRRVSGSPTTSSATAAPRSRWP